MSGMFAGGGKPDWGSAIAAGIQGFQAARGVPGAQQGLQQLYRQRELQQQAQQEAQQYQQQRQDALADYEAKQKIDQQYPTAPQPTEYERMLQAAGIAPGSPDYLKHVNAYVSMKENPIVMTAYGPMPYSAVNGGGSVSAPVGKLTPIQEGGPTPPASGGFPRPY